MNVISPVRSLRPLGIGEILDRAVNLCVRHFLRLSVIYVFYMIPLAFVQYFATKDLSTLFAAIVESSKSGSAASSAGVLKQISAAGPNPIVAFSYFVLLLLSPLPAAALIVATEGFYFGRDTPIGRAYRVGASKYGQLLGVVLLFVVTGLILYFIVVLLAIAIALAVSFLYSAAAALGVAIGVIAGLIAAVFGIALLMLAVLAGQLAYVAVVADGANFAVAFTRSIARVFLPSALGRSLLVGLAFFAIVIGIAIVGGLGQLLFLGLLHSPLAGVAYTAIVRVCSAAFTTAFVVIYYYDLRVRDEGLDLQLAAGEVERVAVPPSV